MFWILVVDSRLSICFFYAWEQAGISNKADMVLDYDGGAQLLAI